MVSIPTLFRRLLATDGAIYECRNCGTTVDPGVETCPRCGTDEIGEYRLQ